MSGPRDRILELLLEARAPLPGYVIGRICALGSWRLYPHLARLERDGLVVSGFANTAKPRARLYSLVDTLSSQQETEKK